MSAGAHANGAGGRRRLGLIVARFVAGFLFAPAAPVIEANAATTAPVAELALDGGSLRGLFWAESTVFRLRSPPEARRIPDMENHLVLGVGLGKDAVETGQRSARDAGQSLRSRR